MVRRPVTTAADGCSRIVILVESHAMAVRPLNPAFMNQSRTTSRIFSSTASYSTCYCCSFISWYLGASTAILPDAPCHLFFFSLDDDATHK